MGWGFPLASHSMTMVSLALTICSFIDCFMMVGGCLTAGREMNKLLLWQDDTNDKWKKLWVTDSPSRGTSKAQTLCHNSSSSSSAGSTIVPIFIEHGIQQNFSPLILLPSGWIKTSRGHVHVQSYDLKSAHTTKSKPCHCKSINI